MLYCWTVANYRVRLLNIIVVFFLSFRRKNIYLFDWSGGGFSNWISLFILCTYIIHTLRVVSIVERHAQLCVGMHYDILDSALYCHSFYCILSHRHRQYKNLLRQGQDSVFDMILLL